MRRTFKYRSGTRPFPALDMTVQSPTTEAKLKIQFRVDTGADITVVPRTVIERLGITVEGEVLIADYDNRVKHYDIHLLDLLLGRVRFKNVEVIPSESESALIGLDVLDQLKVTLDGRKRLLSVE